MCGVSGVFTTDPWRKFDTIWHVDFEYRQDQNHHPVPVCMYAYEQHTGTAIKLRRDKLLTLRQAPFDTGPRSLVVAYAANAELWMGAGVAGAMKRKGGTVIEEEAVRQGPIEPGEAVLTVAGNLPATHVIHAAAMGNDLKSDAGKIAAATRSSLAIAEKHRLLSIAFPALGSGVGGSTTGDHQNLR